MFSFPWTMFMSEYSLAAHFKFIRCQSNEYFDTWHKVIMCLRLSLERDTQNASSSAWRKKLIQTYKRKNKRKRWNTLLHLPQTWCVTERIYWEAPVINLVTSARKQTLHNVRHARNLVLGIRLMLYIVWSAIDMFYFFRWIENTRAWRYNWRGKGLMSGAVRQVHVKAV